MNINRNLHNSRPQPDTNQLFSHPGSNRQKKAKPSGSRLAFKPYLLILTMAFVLLSFSPASAQNGILKGRITDKSTGEGIPFSSVAIVKQGEHDAFLGGISDDQGNFLINKVPYGTYTLMVSFIGYKTGEVKAVSLSDENAEIDFGEIELEPEVIAIETVEVLASSRTSVSKADRRTYQAADYETARGGTAADILGKLPSVNVDGEQEISVRGSSDFVVYLNGMPANTSPSVLLSQIPAENIRTIDIITVPSAAFDAQGMGGIINITTKSDTHTGLTVSATGMLGGTPWNDDTDVFTNHKLTNNRINGGLNLYYNTNKLGLYATVNYTERHNKGIGDIYTFIRQDESQPNENAYYILDGMGARPKWDENLYTSFGTEYKIGPASLLSAGYQYSKRRSGRAAHYKYDTYFAPTPYGNPEPSQLYELFNPNDNHRNGSFQSVHFDYNLNIGGSSSFKASFLYEKSQLEQTINNMEFAYQGDQLYYDYYSGNMGNPVFHAFQRDETPFDAFRLSINYKRSLGNGNVLNLGAVSQRVLLDGTYQYDTINVATGNFGGYTYFNNDISLNRDIHAAFAEFSGNTGNLTYVAGLRLEYLSQLLTVGSTAYFEEVYEVFEDIGRNFDEKEFRQNKFDLFPSLHITYQAGEANTFALAASHRINRPPAKDMAPFLYRRHQEIFEMGDPLLEPEYSWNADLSYNRILGKHNLMLTGFVRTASNAIYRVNRLDYDLANTGGVLLRSFTNAGNQLAAGGELGFNFDLFSRVKLFVGGSLYKFSVESNENLFGDQSSGNSLNYDAKSNLTWTIASPLKFTVDYSYKSNSITPQGENYDFQMMNFALNYSPERLKGWRFHAKLLDVAGTNQEGGYTGATSDGIQIFKRDWVYDYTGRIFEVGASFTFNPGREKSKQDQIGNEYF